MTTHRCPECGEEWSQPHCPKCAEELEVHQKDKTMKTLTELPLEHAAEYDAAAMWCAVRGIAGKIGDPLPANMATVRR